MPTDELVRLGLGLLVLTGATLGVARLAGVHLGWAPLTSLARATVQLSVVALLLRGIFTVPWTVVAFVALMVTAAAWTGAGRLTHAWHGRRAAAMGVVSGAAVSLVLIFALGLVELETRYLVAVSGIVIGNAMSATTLAGRNFSRSAYDRRDEIEAWLSLGATPTEAHREIGQVAVREALLPNIDQTRSTGLVTLPGAFVGALFGGASPAEAAQFQLVVLAGIALAMVVTGVLVTRILGCTPFVSSAPVR